MLLKHWGSTLLLGVTLFAGVLACRISDTLVAQVQPTPTRTRTVRPTFTPLPPPTNTPVPPPPTVAPSPTTRPPTARPQPTATRRPPTLPPAPPPPPQPPAPTVSPYEWSANPPRCEHSGITYLKGAVYSDKNDPGSKTPGMRIAIGGANYSRYDIPPVTTDDFGEYTFVLSGPGQPANKGTFYLWMVDNAGRPISAIGGPIVINGLPPDNPSSCWAGSVDFWK